MKEYRISFVLSFILFIFSINLFAGLPHPVYVEVSLNPNNDHPASIQFNAWINGREDEVLTETSGGCGYIAEEGLLFVQTGSFITLWQPGDVLHIEVTSPAFVTGEFTLTDKGNDFFGPSHFNSNGIDLWVGNNLFTSNKTTIKENESVIFSINDPNKDCTYLWDFDNDGKIDSKKTTATFKYKKSGLYDIKLIIKRKNSSQIILKKKYIKVSK